MIKLLCALVISVLASCGYGADIKLSTKNTVTFRGPVDDRSASQALEELMRLDAQRAGAPYPLYLVLDSPGGDIDSGLDFCRAVKHIDNVETVTLFAASMASAIAQCIEGHRHIMPDGVSMFHRAKVGLQGQINDGELESRLALIKKIVDDLERTNYMRMSMSKAAYKAAVKDELWLYGAEAVKRKAADSVSSFKCDKELIEQKQVMTIVVFIFQIKLEFSKCPLFRSGKPAKESDEDMYEDYLQELKSKFGFNYLEAK